MRTEAARILIELMARQKAMEASPKPESYLDYECRERDESLAHGPRYLPAEWFGALSDAERQRYMRAVYDLDRDGLLVAFKTEGNRLQRVKLTPAGIARAAELAATATEAANA